MIIFISALVLIAVLASYLFIDAYTHEEQTQPAKPADIEIKFHKDVHVILSAAEIQDIINKAKGN